MADPFVGRGEELATLVRVLDGAATGSGRLVLVSGEPGIGKTRLAEELCRVAIARGTQVAWGRSWEGPGTPSYWPWVQVLRRLAIDDSASPALRSLLGIEPPEGDPQEARFRLFDAIAQQLFRASAERPLLLVLDDAHAADVSTLLLLHFVARNVRASRVMILATSRERWFHATPQTSDALAKIAREALHLPLGRLGLDDLSRWIEEAAPHLAENVARLFEASEGNPLFVGELVAAARARREPTATITPQTPHTVRDAVRAHLALLSGPTTRILEIASVLGRELAPAALAALADGPVATALAEAIERGVLVDAEEGRIRFAHVLLRDELYAGLPPERRSEVHRAIARAATDPSIAAHHHLLGASRDHVATAMRAVRVAMQDATRRLAFDDAAQLGERAVATLAPFLTPLEECELRIETGDAWMTAGNRTAGNTTCMRAAELAAAHGDAVLVARAALVAADSTLLGRNPPIIDLLRRALALLPAAPTALRAEVMARLAMAMVPPSPHEAEEHIRLREDAVTMARRLGHEATLLTTLRLATHVFPEAMPVRERFAFNAEALALTDRLGRLPSALSLLAQQVGCHLELGDLDGAIREVARVETRLAAFRQPHFRWRVPLLRAMLAGLTGRFAEADEHGREALRVGREHDVFEALLMFGISRTLLQMNRGDDEGFAEFAELALSTQTSLGGAGPQPYLAVLHAAHDDVASTKACLDASVGVPVHAMPGAVMLAGAAIRTGLVDHAKRFYEVGREHFARVSIAFAPSGTAGPTALVLGQLAAISGDDAAVEPYLRDALARSEQLRARPYVAQTQLAWARFLAARGATDEARRRAEIAGEIAEALGMHRVAADAAAVSGRSAPRARATASPAAPETPAVRLARRGASWVIGANELVLRDSKGLAYLDVLVRDPGREIHVIDLVGGEPDGDAGPMLDAAAKRAYRARVEVLREALDEATAHCDLGRAERARAELDALTHELSRAIGLGGRDRRAASQSERARINVQRRLRDVIRRVAEQDAELARHLELSLKTGLFCSYSAVWPGPTPAPRR